MKSSRVIMLVAATAVLAGAGIAESRPSAGSPAASTATTRKSTRAVVRTRTVVVRGPRGYRGFPGPTGAQGPAGPQGPQGPAGVPGTDHIASLTINWRGADNSPGRDSASAAIPGIGTLNISCNTSTQNLQLVPAAAGVRTAVNYSNFDSTAATNSQLGTTDGSAITLADQNVPGSVLPPNGMVTATFSVEPYTGNGGAGPAPATLMLSSQYKVNDADPSLDFCFVAAQVLTGS